MKVTENRATLQTDGDRVRAVLYIRVSRDEQAQKGFSIPDQKRELLAHAKREGWEAVEVIVDDGYSGAVGVRPGLDRVTELAEAGKIEVVAAKKRNRLFRSRYYRLMYEKDLKELGVELVALDDTGNRFADAMQDEFADWYREELTKNTVAGRMEKARSGKLIRYRTPIFGFTYTADGCAFVVVPEQMAVVERVIRAVAAGKTLYAIRRELEEDGIPAPSGGFKWNNSTIRDMVREDAYRPIPYSEIEPLLTKEARERLDPRAEYGIVRYPKHKVTTLEPDAANGYVRKQKTSLRPEKEQVPIAVVSSGIDRNVIDTARKRIKNNRRQRKMHDRVYELSGIIRCKECGYSIVTARKINGGRELYYYRCARNQRDGKAACPHNKGHRAEALERAVLHALLDVVKDKEDLTARVHQDYERKRQDLMRLHADSRGLQNRLVHDQATSCGTVRCS